MVSFYSNIERHHHRFYIQNETFKLLRYSTVWIQSSVTKILFASSNWASSISIGLIVSVRQYISRLATLKSFDTRDLCSKKISPWLPLAIKPSLFEVWLLLLTWSSLLRKSVKKRSHKDDDAVYPFIWGISEANRKGASDVGSAVYYLLSQGTGSENYTKDWKYKNIGMLGLKTA